MTATPNTDATMIDRAHTDATVYRVAICAFTYHPNKHLDELGWDIAEDVAWCLAPLRALSAELLAEFRVTIATLITTPAADRQAFIRRLSALSGDDGAVDQLT
ncbi:hypothetical protein AB2L57_01035 [Microbacterium sp. HA-8]|uniref:hypothetical protein n=1 Tax=Microbacterium sp. HA-8 TaxID=3234200 RepID=UPI0038F63661